MDAYLAEVARDTNLPLAKFQILVELLPEFSRPSDDGLYRAIDTYLKVIIWPSKFSWRVPYRPSISRLPNELLRSGVCANSSFCMVSQTHPTMTEHERKKLCRVMDCQRLSLEACLHAAQNERLPLRVVVQVNPSQPSCRPKSLPICIRVILQLNGSFAQYQQLLSTVIHGGR